MDRAIWWARRDLRLEDNQALAAACSRAGAVVPLFVLDPAILESDRVGEKRVAFLFGGLRSLDHSLRQRGSRLILRRGDPAVEVARLVREVGAGAVFAERDHSPFARERDGRVAEAAPLQLVGGPTVRPPEDVLKSDKTPYQVYGAYARAWRALPWDSAPALLPSSLGVPPKLDSLPVPESPRQSEESYLEATEAAAGRQLRSFTAGDEAPIYRYAEERDRLDRDAASGLSPYLRFGLISAGRAVAAAFEAMDAAPEETAEQSADGWLGELIWREFFEHLLYGFPHAQDGPFRREYAGIAWRHDPEGLAAWQEGRTGYPVVDAAMRQLAHTGRMPNRARMVAASFLVKDLLIDWREGERWFLQHLMDGDPALNNGNWQWVAGTGADAAPYFRIFNPVEQGRRHDPAGDYVRRWVPELANVPARYQHAPWTMPEAEQGRCRCRIGHDYPAPMVDHREARERTLAAYAAGRAPAEGRTYGAQ
mgnify:FL=1